MATITGTVFLMDDSVTPPAQLAFANLDGSGNGGNTISNLSVGTHQLRAHFTGTVNGQQVVADSTVQEYVITSLGGTVTVTLTIDPSSPQQQGVDVNCHYNVTST